MINTQSEISPKSSGRIEFAAFVWGLCEATFFFLVPDLLLMAIGIMSFKRGLRAIGFAVFGALCGGLMLYSVAALSLIEMDDLSAFLLDIPFISDSMLDTINEGMSHSPEMTLLTSGFIGIPYKIYAVFAGLHGMNVVSFLLLSGLMRTLRFTFLVLLVEYLLKRPLKQHCTLKQIYVIWALIASAIYMIYFILIV